MPSSTDDTTLDDFMSVSAFIKRYPDLATTNKIQWWLFRKEHTGILRADAMVKRCGRWYVCVPRFKNWLANGAPPMLEQQYERERRVKKKKARR
jgi:hypothetical protein